MTIHDATEVAYKNGYAAGKRDAAGERILAFQKECEREFHQTNMHKCWIPVTERLPKHGDIVLCHMSFDEMMVLQRDDVYDGWVNEKNYANRFVTHWMPLPEPPKEDK